MYSVIWQITQQGDQFVATAVRSGTYDGSEFFKDLPTKREPVIALTLEALRLTLQAPPYSVAGKVNRPCPPPVIEEWS